ncbi:MAG: hypothetical protein UR98_C0005G0011 [Parcubacteria group bacterium GW2011_GWA1_36_12]|nr:MAG: hypothetical protein UR98_C0005G0011 [Parcubacteria group bacterium GW2011_GWA1_36_12]
MDLEKPVQNAVTLLDESVRIAAENAHNLKHSQIVDLNRITARCFGKDVPLQETIDHVHEANVLTLLMVRGEIKGYGLNSKLVLNGTDVNYFGSGFIDPDLHNRRHYSALNAYRDLIIQTDTIMTRTQNPKIYSAFRKLCFESGRNSSPSSNGEIDEVSLSLARAFFLGCTDEQICRGVYGRELMSATPKPDEATKHVMGKLDASLGDAVILVGRRT